MLQNLNGNRGGISDNVLQLTEVGDYEAQKLEYKNNV